jgi:hypothetical protein
LNLLRVARRNNDSHGGEKANYYYLKVDRKYLSTSFEGSGDKGGDDTLTVFSGVSQDIAHEMHPAALP